MHVMKDIYSLKMLEYISSLQKVLLKLVVRLARQKFFGMTCSMLEL